MRFRRVEAEFCNVVAVNFIVLELLLRAGSDVPMDVSGVQCNQAVVGSHDPRKAYQRRTDAEWFWNSVPSAIVLLPGSQAIDRMGD